MPVTPTPTREATLGRALVALALLLYCVLTALAYFFIEEDSYIYFRAAENIAGGFGYVFNIGDTPVESGSGPLWQYLLALGIYLGAAPIPLIKLLGLSCGLGTVYLVYLAGRNFASPAWGGAAALMIAGSTPFVWWANSGLELAAYTLLLSGCLLICSRPGRIGGWRAIPFVLLLFVRPEAFLIVPVFLLFFAFNGQRAFALRVLISCALGYSCYLAFRLFYFHEVQVSAFYSKITAEGASWSYIWFVLKELRILYPLALAIPALLLLKRMSQPASFMLLVALSLMGIFFAGSNFDFKPYFRFYALALPQFYLLFACAGHALSQLTWRPSRAMVAAYACFAVVAVIWVPRIELFAGRSPNALLLMGRLIAEDPARALASYRDKLRDPQSQVPLDGMLAERSPLLAAQCLDQNYQAAIGHFLRENYPQGLRIVYDQMGQTAYLAGKQQHFVDLLGLASPPVSLYYFNLNAANSHAKQLYKRVVDPLVGLSSDSNRDIGLEDALQYVYDQNPDVVLIHGFVTRNPLTLTYHLSQSQWLRDNYIPRYQLAHWVTVYERKDHPYPLKASSFPPSLDFRAL
ncbi:hypothetical protein JVX91_05815 [Pseudomonas sp. PDNC002]|uniref:hypothetical protein n=1 Tax=Pseudomonas sp. PDNC002 TaxID=2811422 RepID=UPI001964C59A|nr:hypothetical protein [Pseudomonas sp. PDNC002]QRY80620.1 hypothetical protein JVX91_05815 [Pseudomonas sp. PDNC002]